MAGEPTATPDYFPRAVHGRRFGSEVVQISLDTEMKYYATGRIFRRRVSWTDPPTRALGVTATAPGDQPVLTS